MHIEKHGTKWLAVLIALAQPIAACAQPADAPHPQRIAGYFQMGWTRLDLEALNAQFEKRARGIEGVQTYSTMSDNALSIGGGMHVLLGRWRLGGEGHGLIVPSEELPKLDMTLRGGYGVLQAGYEAWAQRGWSLVPLIGLGGGGLQLDLMDPSALTFDEFLSVPRRGSQITTGGLVVDLGVALDKLVLVRSGRGGPLFGVRAGVLFSPAWIDWRLSGTRVRGGPDVGIAGPYVRVALGGAAVR